jgi:hypothetical protein
MEQKYSELYTELSKRKVRPIKRNDTLKWSRTSDRTVKEEGKTN